MTDDQAPPAPQQPAIKRGANGQFLPGHAAAGRTRKTAKPRAEIISDALWKQLSPLKLRKLAAAVVDEACGGQGESARAARTELLNRLAGRPGSASMQQALDSLKKDIEALKSSRSITSAKEPSDP